MSVLHNRVNAQEMKARMLAETEPRTTISFYCYFHIADPQAFRDELYGKLDALKVFGRIYVAREGVNAQLSVPASNADALREALYGYPDMNGIRLNVAVDDDGKSFWILKIKVREKIVADGIDDPEFDATKGGAHLGAAAFNALAENPDAIIVDMRNHYEYEVGHFENAIEVPSDTFREQLPMAVAMLGDKKDAPVIMYCTGGIRCEKASAYLVHHGFKNVFQLEGGIIEYTRQAREQGLPLKFIGKNFVFDDRMGERITDDVIAHCHQCGAASDRHVNCANDACHLLFIQCEACAEKMAGCCSPQCATESQLPEEARAALAAARKADGVKAFNKSRDARLRPYRGDGVEGEA